MASAALRGMPVSRCRLVAAPGIGRAAPGEYNVSSTPTAELRAVLNAVLQTERLVLRPLLPADARHLLQYVLRNRDWLAPWEPTHAASYFTTEGQRGILLQCEDERRADTGILFGIYEREGDPAEVLGRISISGIMRGIWQNGFLGYSIACARAGRGYMTESLRHVVHYGFMDLGLHRLQASIIPRNGSSLRVAQKCGFRHEGRALRYLKINDLWEDHDMYALTREEFDQGASR